MVVEQLKTLLEVVMAKVLECRACLSTASGRVLESWCVDEEQRSYRMRGSGNRAEIKQQSLQELSSVLQSGFHKVRWVGLLQRQDKQSKLWTVEEPTKAWKGHLKVEIVGRLRISI